MKKDDRIINLKNRIAKSNVSQQKKNNKVAKICAASLTGLQDTHGVYQHSKH